MLDRNTSDNNEIINKVLKALLHERLEGIEKSSINELDELGQINKNIESVNILLSHISSIINEEGEYTSNKNSPSKIVLQGNENTVNIPRPGRLTENVEVGSNLHTRNLKSVKTVADLHATKSRPDKSQTKKTESILKTEEEGHKIRNAKTPGRKTEEENDRSRTAKTPGRKTEDDEKNARNAKTPGRKAPVPKAETAPATKVAKVGATTNPTTTNIISPTKTMLRNATVAAIKTQPTPTPATPTPRKTIKVLPSKTQQGFKVATGATTSETTSPVKNPIVRSNTKTEPTAEKPSPKKSEKKMKVDREVRVSQIEFEENIEQDKIETEAGVVELKSEETNIAEEENEKIALATPDDFSQITIPKIKIIVNYLKDINNHGLDMLIEFLDKATQMKLVKLSKNLGQKILTNMITKTEKEYLDLQNKFKAYQDKFPADCQKEFDFTSNCFTMSRGAAKAIELLNDTIYLKLFTSDADPAEELKVVYRIYFMFIEHPISKIEDGKEFWKACCNYFLTEDKTGINIIYNLNLGTLIGNLVKNFKFSNENIYNIGKISEKHINKIAPVYFSRICGTTGLLIFLIKDALEYAGLISQEKKTPPYRIYSNHLYSLDHSKIHLNKLQTIKDKIFDK